MTPDAQLDAFIDRYSPEVAACARDVLDRMRAICPGATELVYDNYNALAIGFAHGDRVRDVVFSIALYPRWVSLFLFGAATLPDPARKLKGGGSSVRHVVLTTPAVLEDADVRALIDASLERAGGPFRGGERRLVVKSVSARQRPRRPGG